MVQPTDWAVPSTSRTVPENSLASDLTRSTLHRTIKKFIWNWYFKKGGLVMCVKFAALYLFKYPNCRKQLPLLPDIGKKLYIIFDHLGTVAATRQVPILLLFQS